MIRYTPRFLALVAVICAWCGLAGAQSTAAPSPQPTPQQREAAWLNRNHVAPPGQSAAKLLFQAIEQRRALHVASPARPLRGASPHAGQNATGWQELGPKPLNALPATTQIPTSYGMLSGRVTALDADLASDPTGNTLYVGTAGGGLWKSTDALSASPTFTPLTDSLPTLSVGAIAIDASTQPATIYIGTGDPNTEQDSYSGMGIFKSTDGGTTWTQSAWADQGAHTFFGLSVSRLLIDPSNPRHLLAATVSSPRSFTGPFPEIGIYSSSDAGQTWTLAAQFNDQVGLPQNVTDLAWDATNKIWYAAARGLGVYSSADGSTWTATSSPVLNSDGVQLFTFQRASLAVRNGTVYVLYCAFDGNLPSFFPPDTGLAQSTDQGKTWTVLKVPASGSFNDPTGYVFWSQGNYEQTLVAPPNSNALLLGGVRLWITPDITVSNPTWNAISGSDTPVFSGEHAIAVVDATTWFNGTEGGVWSTSDSGSTWTNDNATLADDLLIDATPAAATGAYVAADGMLGTAVANNDGTTAWTQSLSDYSSASAIDPSNPKRVYAHSLAPGVSVSDDGGKTFPGQVGPSQPFTDSGAPPFGFTILPQRPADIVMGDCRVWFATAYLTPLGADLHAVSPDLSQDAPKTQCFPASKGYVTSIASAPSDANTMYALVSNQRVMGTTDLFADQPVWTNLTAAPLPSDGSHLFSAIAVSPTDAKTVYIGVGGFQTPHLFKSSDGGASWMDVTGNLPDAPVNSITVDPVDPTNVYVATDAGVFVATDAGVAGETWQVMGAGLPNAPVMSLKFAPGSTRVLVAATHGRGAWAIAPLSTKPDFSLQISPDFLTASGSQPLQITASIAAINAYSGTVTLSCVTPTTGCTIAQPSVQAGQSATISIDPSALPQGGPVTISATDGTLTHSQSADMRVAGLSVSPATVEVLNSGWTTVTGLNLDGTGAVTCGNLPSGVTCTPQNSISTSNPSTTLEIDAGATAVPGTYTIQVTDTTASQSFSAPLTINVEDFRLQVAPDNATVYSPNDPVTLSASLFNARAFTGPVALACDPASGVQCSFSPSVISGYLTSNFTVTNLGALAQPLQVTIIGTSGNEKEKTTFTIQLLPFSVKVVGSPIAVVTPGADTAGFDLAITGVRPGTTPTAACSAPVQVSCQLDPFTHHLTISGLAAAPAGTTAVPIQAQVTAGAQQQTIPLSVQFGDFILSPDQYLKQVVSGTDTTSFTVTAAPQNGTQWTAPVPLTCTAPSGVSCSLTPGSITPGQSATLNVSGLGTLKPQQLNVYVNGSPNPDAHQMKLYIQVADFQLSSPSASSTLAAGADTATFTVHDTGLGQMRGPVQLACANSAPISCSFSPANLVGGTSSTLTVSGLSKATATNDAIAINVTGTAGTDSHTLALSVNVPDFVPAPASGSSTSQTVTAGQTAKYSLDYSAVNGFSGNVTMSCSGAPAQATCSVSPASFTLSGGTTQTVTVSVQTTGSSLATPVDGDRPGSAPRAGLLALLGLAALASLAALPRRRRIAFGAALLFGALLLAGCGGGSGSSTPAPPAVQPTPSGSSTLTVTATANGVAHTTQLTLKVQ